MKRIIASLLIAFSLHAQTLLVPIAWDPVTTYEDGTAITNLTGIRYSVYQSSSQSMFPATLLASNIVSTNYTVTLNYATPTNVWWAAKAYETNVGLASDFDTPTGKSIKKPKPPTKMRTP